MIEGSGSMGRPNEGPTPMTAVVLPARAVYLIAGGSRSGFVRAVQEASGRWGGVTEPIVPVGADGSVSPEHGGVVGAAALEAAVNVDVEAVVAERAAEALGLPLVPLDRAGTIATCPVTAVRALPAFQSSQGRIMFSNPQIVHAAAAGPLWEITALGCPSEGVRTESRPALGGDDVWRAQLGGGGLLGRTLDQFGEYERLMPGEARPVLWITSPDSLADCLDFWNLRALRPIDSPELPMLLCTPEVVHWQQSASQLRHFLNGASQNASNIALMTRSLTPGTLQETAGALELERAADPAETDSGSAGSAAADHSIAYRTDLDPALWVRGPRSYGVVGAFDVHLIPGRDTAMRITSPVVFREPGGALLRVAGAPLDGLPQRQEVADLMGYGAAWRGKNIQFSTQAAPAWSFELRIPTLQAAAHALLDAVTTQYAPSQPGRLATALQGRADMRLLLDAGVYECANALTTPRSGKLLRELEEKVATQDARRDELLEIASRWGGRAERRFLPARKIQMSRDIALEALEKLCLMGWAERGLEAPCDACGITSFHSMLRASHQPACPACQAPVTYTHDAGNLSVAYRLNGVVDRAADHGVLPHLLVIAALTRDEPLSYLLPGTDLTFADGQTPEVDIFGIWGGRVLAGEVKTSSNEFDTEQVERDVKLSKRLGADVHLLAALDTVPASTVRQAGLLCRRAGMGLVVYDQARLRPAVSAPSTADTAQDAFARLQTALGLLLQALERDGARAAAKAGLILKTAMEPRSPSAGQVAALNALVDRYGADLITPLRTAAETVARLADTNEEPGLA